MKRNKLLCGIMIIVTLLCSCVTSFAASSSVALTTEVSEIELYSGDEVELTLKLDNYKDIEKGLNAYKAKIEYDEDVFETLTESSFTPLNNWEGLAFNKDTNEFISIKKIGSTSSESIVKIKFKVKDDVKGQDTKIYIKDFVTSEGKYDIYAENVVESTEIHIIEKSNQLPDEDIDKDENPVVPDDSEDNTNTVINNTVIDNTNTTVDNTTIDNTTNTTVDNTTIDNNTNTTIDNTTIDNTNTTVDNTTIDNTTNTTVDNTTIDNNTNTSVDNTTIDSNTNTTVNNTTTDNTNTVVDNTNTTNEGGNTNTSSNTINNSETTNTTNNTNQATNSSTNSTTNKNTNQTNNQTTNKNTSITTNTTSGGSQTSTNVTKNGNTQNNSDSTSTKKLPATGLSIFNRVVFIAIIVLIGIAVLIRRKEIKLNLIEKNKKSDKKEKAKKLFGLFLIVGIISATELTGIVKAAGNKGELNSDNSIDYADVYLLEKYLISLVDIDNDKLENADINGDRYITVTDLTLLVQKIEKKLDYTVDITDVEISNYYPEKGEDLDVRISADVSYGAEIEKVVINGTEYSVTKENGADIYDVKIKAPENAGVYEYNITEVTLDNEQTVEINHSENISVLKQLPSISDYKLEENAAESKLSISFNFVDTDSTKTSGSFIIIDSNSNSMGNQEVVVGENKIEFQATEGESYTVKINVDYDLASEQLTDNEEDHTGNLIKEETAKLAEYNLSLSNIALYNSAESETTVFEKNEDIKVKFTSENSLDIDVEKIIIDGKEYDVTKTSDNNYELTIPGYTETGDKTATISEVILSNGKHIGLTENNTITVSITKEKPLVQDVVTTEENDKLSVSFNLVDEDSAIEKASVVVTDEKDNILLQEDVTAGNYNKEIDIAGKFINKFNVKILADYNLSGETVKDEVLYENSVSANPKIEVTEATVSKEYIEKNETFKIQYKITTNQTENITRAIVNNLDVETTKIDDTTYEVELQAPSTSGNLSVSLSKFYIGDTEVEVSANNKVEVLKSALSIEDYTAEDNATDDTVTIGFTVVDDDNAFISGKVQLVKNSDGEVKQEETISKTGDNEFVLSVEEGEEYTLKVTIKQGRDIEKENVVSEEVLLEKPIQFVRSYDLVVEDIKTTKQTGEVSSYFEKGESYNLTFTSTNKTKFYPEYAIVNGTKYQLTKNEDTYTLELTAKDVSGIEELKIEEIYMNNAKELTVDADNTIEIEVLKDAPKVEDFAYDKTNDDALQMQFNLVDSENTLESAKIKIQDAAGNTLKEEAIKVGENTVEVNMTTSEKYTATILATYDLDTNTLDQNSNKYTDKEIYSQEMTASKDVIELKDVSNITLYRTTSSSAEEIDTIDITSGIPTDVENYYAKIEMSTLPTYYANIKEFKTNTKANQISVVIDQENFIMYEETDQGLERQNEFSFDLPYIDEDGTHTLVTDATDFFAEIAKDLSGNYELTEDLDASKIDVTATAAIAGTFKGTLNGNGYSIINLPTVLFEKLNGATIKNLVIEDANITNDSKAILATAIENNTTVESTYIKNSTLSNNQNGVGAFTGGITNSIIKNCAAIQINIKANNTIGGISGQMSSGSTVEDCYVTGTIQGTISHSLGARVGGITGWDSGTLIDHCYTNVNIISTSITGNGGLIGGPRTAYPTITNSLSMSTGKGYKIAGFDVLTNVSNVYEYSGSNATTNINDSNSENVKEITNLYDKSFYKDTLGFDEEIWNLDLIENGKLPNLKSDPMPNVLEDYELMENKNNIPNFEEVKKNNNYKSDREIAYYNMAQLMPYANTEKWVECGNTIDNALITTQKIKFIIPLTENNEFIAGLQAEDVSNIKKIRVVFEDEESVVYTVEYSKTLDNIVAIYNVNELNLQYQFNDYISNIDESLLNDIVSKASEYDYTETISAITTETESRLYVDYYDESVKSNIGNVIKNYIMTNTDLPTYNSNSYLQKQITNTLSEENIIKLIYSYNYYDKWYHIDFDGIVLSDLMFFDGKILNSGLTADYLITSVCDATEAQRKTNATTTFYSNLLQTKIDKGLTDFLSYMMKVVNGYNDPNDWFVDHFDGVLVEQKAYGASDEVRYRIWDLMCVRSHLVLPVLTAPQEDMYLISCPSQIVIGSMNRYSTYLTKDGEERQRMKELITGYAEKIGNFYGSAAGILSDATTVFNARVNVQYDTRFSFPASDKVDAGTQASGTTRDPVLKWVYEAIGSWGAANGSGAYADGTDVYWIVYQALGGDFSFSVFTHETAHNQDGKVFYSGAGRRSGTGAEAHSDGNIRQEYGNGIMVFNLSYDLDITKDYTNNFSYKTINTPESIYKYYKEMFEVKYVLDYLEGQAFLRLTPEEQANVAVQAVHTASGSSFSTAYTRLTAEDFENMNLKTMEDLWDNQLGIRTVSTSVTASGYNGGQYGYESYYCVNWYQSHNDEGVPDVYSFKRLGQEMLGVGGYENGYVTYMSGKSSNDLDALRKITGDDDITWKEYKLNRYETVKQNLENISYFDYNEVIDEFEAALKADAANGNLNSSINTQTLLYGIVKRATSDFTDGGIYDMPSVTSITSAEQLITLANANQIGNYRLDADLDFSGIDIGENNSYITNQFIGTLNGNGHKITGVKYPIFNSILYADITDITIENPEYVGAAQASLAITSSNSVIKNIRVVDSNLGLQIIKTKSNRYYEYGTIESTIKDNNIDSLEELLAIASTDESRKKKYNLTADIDLSSVTTDSAAILAVTFEGSINGNGHTLSNLSAPLFTEMSSATIENLNIENGTITGTYAKGILANTIQNSTISKVNISGVTLESSGSNGVGGLSGGMTSCCVSQVSLEDISIKANNTIGGIAGQINSSTVDDCIVTGTITGTEWSNPNGARIGGITGWFSGGTINNCLTKVDIVNSRIIGNGGLIGGPSSGSRTITNCISLSTGEKAYRLAGWSATLAGASNVYEYELSNSTTQITEDNSTIIKLATEDDIKTVSFYTEQLGWSEGNWDFSEVESGGLPKLKQ